MSKLWFAFSKRAAVCVAVSAILAFSGTVLGATPATETIPQRTFVLSEHAQALRVGDTFAYTLQGGGPDESRWEIDPKQGGLKSGFLFRSGRLFTPLMPGELSLPPLSIVNEKGEVVARTEEIKITIASNFTDQDRASGKPPTPEPAIGPLGLPFPAWIQSAIAFSILGIVLIAGYFLFRFIRRKAAKALRKMLPQKPYDLASLERIDALLKQGLLEKSAFKPFYFTISEVLKFYFGERFSFDAQESTTSELIALLKERTGEPGLTEAAVRRAQNLFDRLDPVKFADVVPSIEEAKEVQREARDLISSTRKAAIEPILKEAR